MRKFWSALTDRTLILILAFAVLNLFQGCMAYRIAVIDTGKSTGEYTITDESPINVSLLDKYNTKKKYFILYNRTDVYQLSDISIADGAIYATLSDVGRDHVPYVIMAGGESPVLQVKRQNSAIDSEVLLYTQLEIPKGEKSVMIPVSSIQKMYRYTWKVSGGAYAQTMSIAEITLLLDKYNSKGKYFILYNDFEVRTSDKPGVYHLSDITIVSDTLGATLKDVGIDHIPFLIPPGEKTPVLKVKYRNPTIDNELLLFAHLEIPKDANKVMIPLKSIQQVLTYNWKLTAGSIAAIVIIPTVVAVIVGAIVVALTKSSCPYVYTYENGAYKFAGEIYSGAVYASLERNDYLYLTGFKPSDGKYLIRIANELPEVQYLNLSELWVVSHPLNTTVLADRKGNIHTMGNTVPPDSAFSAGHAGQQALVSEADQQSFLFNEEPSVTGDTNAKNALFLTFQVPPGCNSGKLVVRAKNSYWGDYVFGEFTKEFGRYYPKWIKQKGKESPEKPLQWKKDQNLPLMVYVETGTGWQFVDYFDMAGPLAFRDMVMPVDLSAVAGNGLPGSRQARIRIETGFMFWELDYAGMDFTTDLPLDTTCVRLSSAVSESGERVDQLLAGDDERYYVQPETGNNVALDFAAPDAAPGMESSVILHTKGYYTHVRDYQGAPDRKELETFRNPGRLSEFSFEKFNELRNNYGRKDVSSGIK
jgi:hypothetical protein